MSDRKALRELHEGLKNYFDKHFFFLYNTNSDRLDIIDEHDGSILFDYTSKSGRSTYRYIRVKDISTGKHTFLSVPYESRSCIHAIAWTFSMVPSEYKLMKET